MSGVIAPQKTDSMGQIAGLAQIAKTAYDMKKGGAAAAPTTQQPMTQQTPPAAPPPAQPDLSAGQVPQNNPGAIDRRIKTYGGG